MTSYKETFYVKTPQNGQSYKFFGDFSLDKDVDDCMGTATLEMPYSNTLWSFWEPGFTDVEIWAGTFDSGKIFKGRTRKTTQDGEKIKIELQDCGWKLKKPFTDQIADAAVKTIFVNLCNAAGLQPVLMGLTQNYQYKNETDDSTEEDNTVDFKVGSNNTGGSFKSFLTDERGGLYDQILHFSTRNSSSGSGAGASGAGTVSGLFKDTCGLSKEYPYDSRWWLCTAINKCGLCNKPDNTLLYNPKKADGAEWTCKACGADFCGIDGWDKSSPPRGKITVVGNPILAKGSTVKTPSITINETNKSTGSSAQVHAADTTTVKVTKVEANTGATSSSGDTSTDSGPDWDTYEDALKAVCDQAAKEYGVDLIFYTNQDNQCILVDYPSLMKDIASKAFTIEEWMMEYPSFVLDVNQFGFANTAIVKYKNGTVKESYEDLVAVYGEMPKYFSQPKLTKSEAQNYALAKLAQMLRDFALEIKCDVLHSYKIYPGGFVRVPNPITKSEEIYYVQGINVSGTPKEALKCSLSLLYAPKNPEVDNIPEIGGPGSIAGIGQAAAKFGYSSACQDAACMIKLGAGSCWAMSEYLYNNLTAIGIRCRIVQYPTAYSPRHRSVQLYQGGKWVDFPYTTYKLNKMFKATSGSTHGSIIKG